MILNLKEPFTLQHYPAGDQSFVSAQQATQDAQYSFPYHHIPTSDGRRFSQTRSLAWGYEYLAYLEFVRDLVLNLGFQVLLDVGCGDGRFLHELSRRRLPVTLVGVDYSERAVALARAMSPSVTWLVGDIRGEGVIPAPADIVTMIETMEHIPPVELESVVRAIREHLKPTGSYVVTVPSANVPVHRKHYQHFTPETLRAVLVPYFEIRQLYFLNRNGSVFLRLAGRILDNRVFVVREPRILGVFFRYYRQRHLCVSAGNCRRIAAVCVPSRNI